MDGLFDGIKHGCLFMNSSFPNEVSSQSPGSVNPISRRKNSTQIETSKEKVSDCFGRFLVGSTISWLTGIFVVVAENALTGKISNLDDTVKIAAFSFATGMFVSVVTRSPKEAAYLAAFVGTVGNVGYRL